MRDRPLRSALPRLILLSALLRPHPGRGADASDCAALFARTRDFVAAGARLGSHAEWARYRPAGREIESAYVRAGLRAPFVARQMAALVLAGGATDLRLLDLAGPDFADALARDSSLRSQCALGRPAGLCHVAIHDGRMRSTIAIDTQTDLDAYADAWAEEVLHLRLKLQWLDLEFTRRPPRIFTAAGLGLRQLLEEFIVKDVLRVRGRGLARDREATLREVAAAVGHGPRATTAAFYDLLAVLEGCAKRFGTTGADLPIPRVLTCVYAIDAAELRRMKSDSSSGPNVKMRSAHAHD